ncbi:TPR-like protein [Rhizophagus irregularis]|uniref:TPR-like protein n=3 Tax=Rhizophagus irregularis TaxID=588596 RepID=A0A2N0QF81_9GLOM|nr:TPR-like protein [Rhizophagus irregularis]
MYNNLPNSYPRHQISVSGSLSENITLNESSLTNDRLFNPPIPSSSLKVPLSDDIINELLSGDLISNPKSLLKLNKLASEQPNQWTVRSLVRALEKLCDTKCYTYTSNDTAIILELHLRTFASVLEAFIQSPAVLGRELREKLYKQLVEFNNIHNNISTVMEQGLNKTWRGTLRNLNVPDVELQTSGIKRNYNIFFLLIHLRDTLHSLSDDETRFREGWRRFKDFFKGILGMAPAVLTPIPADSASILTSWNKMRDAFGFKVPVSSWYKDWRLLLMLQQTLDSSYQEAGNHNLKKFGERMILEFLWFHIKKIISELTPSKDDDFEFSKILNNKKRLFAELYGMEPLSYPHTFWFGILDLAESVCASSTRSITLSLCYYLALESLNHAPNTFVRFKAIEILLSLQHRRKDWFVVVDADLKECGNKFQDQKKSKFFGLVDGVKYKLVSREKLMKSCGISNNLDDDFPAFTTTDIDRSGPSILSLLAQEMLCPVMLQITDQFYGLSCGHVISKGAFNIYKSYRSRKGKNLICSICRTVINEESLTLLPQTSTLNALSDKFVAAGLLSQTNISEYEISNPDTIMSDDIKKSKSLNDKSQNETNETTKKVTEQLITPTNPPDPLIIARECFKQNPQNPQKALLILDKTLQNNEKAPLAYLERAKIYTHLRRYGEALYDVNNSLSLQSLQDDDDNIEAYKLRSRLHFHMKNYEQALQDITIVLNRIESYKIDEDYTYASSDLEAYELRGNIFMKIGSFTEAIADFTIVVENDKFNVMVLTNRGSLFREIRKYRESLEDLTKAIQLNPSFPFAKLQRGSVYCKLNKFAESLKDLEDVLNSTTANDDDKLFATAERGELYCRQNMLYEALIDLEYVLAQNPHHDFARSRRGYVFFKLKKYDSALVELNEALRLNKTNYYGLTYRGMVHFKLGDYQNSLKDLNLVLDRYPNNSVATRQRGIAYLRMGKFEEGLMDFDRLINLDAKDIDALCYRSEIFYELGRYKDCIEDCNTILQYDSSNLIALRIRGMVLRKFHQNNKSLLDLDKVLLQQPTNEVALLERAAVYAALRQYPSSLADCEKILYLKPRQSIQYFQEITKVYGELSEAIGVDEIFIHLERVLQDSPNNAYVLTTRAYIYLLQWECDKAIKDLNISLINQPNFVPTLYQRSIIYRITQDYGNALKDLEKILEVEPGNSLALTERNEIQSMKDFDRNLSLQNYHEQTLENQVSRRSSQTSVTSSNRSNRSSIKNYQ